MKRRVEDELGLLVAGKREDLAYTVDGKIRIVIFNKPGAQVAEKNVRVVPFDELPKTSLTEFSILLEGLVPCAALHSIASVREQTYSLLALMNKKLDGAFCAHRALIDDADDSIDFILNLISQEMSTKILCDELARSALSIPSLEGWHEENPLPVDNKL